ncbi:MAG: DUF1295 domain-containing protein, partial [Planctomycetota bacterium]
MLDSTSINWSQLTAPVGITLVAVPIAFLGLWWRQTRTQNATSVDAAWAIAIGVLGVGSALGGDGSVVQRLIAGGLSGIWSARLAWHLLRHRVFGHDREDGRYRAMREHWGARANASFFWFYQAQVVAALVFAMPFWFVANHSPDLQAVQLGGLGLWLAAQLCEAMADHQLEAHRADPSARGRA